MEDDRRLVAAARAGSNDAVARLFDRHWQGVWRAAYAVTGRCDLADDIAQDAFVRAIQALPTFDEERPIAPWLARIAVNRAIDILRRERRIVALDELGADAADDPEPDEELLRALLRLGWERRAIVVLHYWIGYQLTDIAEILNVPLGTCRARILRSAC